MTKNNFASRHNGVSNEAEVKKMLEAIGVSSIHDGHIVWINIGDIIDREGIGR